MLCAYCSTFTLSQRWSQGQKCQGQGHDHRHQGQDQGLWFWGQDQGQGLEFQGQGQGRQLPASRHLEVKATASRTPSLLFPSNCSLWSGISLVMTTWQLFGCNKCQSNVTGAEVNWNSTIRLMRVDHLQPNHLSFLGLIVCQVLKSGRLTVRLTRLQPMAPKFYGVPGFQKMPQDARKYPRSICHLKATHRTQLIILPTL